MAVTEYWWGVVSGAAGPIVVVALLLMWLGWNQEPRDQDGPFAS